MYLFAHFPGRFYHRCELGWSGRLSGEGPTFKALFLHLRYLLVVIIIVLRSHETLAPLTFHYRRHRTQVFIWIRKVPVDYGIGKATWMLRSGQSFLIGIDKAWVWEDAGRVGFFEVDNSFGGKDVSISRFFGGKVETNFGVMWGDRWKKWHWAEKVTLTSDIRDSFAQDLVDMTKSNHPPALPGHRLLIRKSLRLQRIHNSYILPATVSEWQSWLH